MSKTKSTTDKSNTIAATNREKMPEAKAAATASYDWKTEVDALVAKAHVALTEFMSMDQETVDRIVNAMTLAGVDQNLPLAKMAVEETGRGVVEDKVIKNIYATEYIFNSIKHKKTVGIIDANDHEGYIAVAEPVGVIAGVTPVTNPTSTTMFKSIISVKARNPIVFAFHPSAQKCSEAAAKVVRDAAIKAGAPKDCVQWIAVPTMDGTMGLLNHDGIALILATGGAGMVKSAYSAGKPALGVGPGNVPCYINKDVDIERACTDLMLSKTFDNGMICASEQAAIVDKEISGKFEAFMKANNCHFCTAEETAKLEAFIINKEKLSVNAACVGQPADWIAAQAGIKVNPRTKILIAKLPEPSLKYPLSLETLMPVIAYFIVDGEKQGFEYAKKMLELGGLGHSASIHTNDNDLALRYGQAMMVGRVVINQPSSQGAIGDIYNTKTPSLTLGCGSYGRNSTTQNVSAVNLINIKRISMRRENMQWFKIPPRIYFQNGSVQYLEKMPNIKRAIIVTDPVIRSLGYVDKVLYYLRKREPYVNSMVFSDVEPDPSVETVMRGVEVMKTFQPDVIISLGGGSAIDAAKAMWLFYEHPDTDFEGLRLKFLDIRKRSFKFPNLGNKAKFVAIPTTSGTGSEVTSFTVITDNSKGTKYPLADYELTPDVAIVDPQFVATMPKSIVADTGLDVLTHAIEAYVSILASDYTDGLAMQAIEMVFEHLYDSYSKEDNAKAREKMHNASAIAGMAFTNSFLGINHSLAHKIGGEFGVAHGRANAILMPHVIAYNATKPDKFATFPKYGVYNADERYAQIATRLGLGGKTTQEKVNALIEAIKNLLKKLNIPQSFRECGIDEKDYMSKIAGLAERAFDDQCTTANPRYPLIKDLEEVYRKAF